MCLLGVKSKVSKRNELSGEPLCLLGKRLPSIFTYCALSNLLFFSLRATDWPTTTFLDGMLGYFPVIRLANFFQVATVIVVAL